METANGMVWLAYVSKYNETDKTFHYQIFSGVCAYGWKNAEKFYLEKMGRLDELDKFEWMHGSTHVDGVTTEILTKCKKDTFEHIEDIVIPDFNYDDLWRGISPEMLAEFHGFVTDFCEEHGLKGYAEKVKNAPAEFVNPGDVFISEALGLKATKTKVKTKKKKQPLMMRALKQLKQLKHK